MSDEYTLDDIFAHAVEAAGVLGDALLTRDAAESLAPPDAVGRWLLEHGFTGTDRRGVKWVDGKEVKGTPDGGGEAGAGAHTAPAKSGGNATGGDERADLGKLAAAIPAGEKGRFAGVKEKVRAKLEGTAGGRAVLAMGDAGAWLYHHVERRALYVAGKVQAVAAEAARQRGLSERGAEKLRRALFAADFVGGYATGGLAAALGLPLAAVKAAAVMPSASVAYLAYSTARDPAATWRAAKKVAADALASGASRSGLGGASRRESEEAVAAVGPELASALADRIGRPDVDSEWWLACFCAALGQTGDAGRALELADAAAAARPDGPGDSLAESEDAEGHEHRGKGAGGGQFAPKGSGGGGAAGAKKAARAKQPASKARAPAGKIEEVGEEETPTLADQKEWRAARAGAKKLIAAAPVPPGKKVRAVRAKLNAWKKAAKAARAAGGRVPKLREYYDARGGTDAHRRRAKRLFERHGGAEKGYVVCHGTGIKMHWTDDPAENPAGLPKFEQGKIFVAFQGGGYDDANVLPEHPSYNRLRGNKPLREENLK